MDFKKRLGQLTWGALVTLWVVLIVLVVVVASNFSRSEGRNKTYDILVGGSHYTVIVRGGHAFMVNITLDSLAIEEHNIKLLMGQLTTYPFITSKNMVEDNYRKQKTISKKRRK